VRSHHVRTLQVLKAASALRQARLAGGGADDAVVPTSSATLARGLHRRVDPLALYASRQGLPEVLAFFWHPHHIAHHPRMHRQFALLAAVCRCILVLEDQLACSTSKRPIVLPFIALRPVSAPPSERVGVCRAWPA